MIKNYSIAGLPAAIFFNGDRRSIEAEEPEHMTGDTALLASDHLIINHSSSARLDEIIDHGRFLYFNNMRESEFRAPSSAGRMTNQVGNLFVRYGPYGGQTFELPLFFDTSNGLKEKEAHLIHDDQDALDHLLDNLELGTTTNPATRKVGELADNKGSLEEYGCTIPLSTNIKEQLRQHHKSLEAIELECALAIGAAQNIVREKS